MARLMVKVPAAPYPVLVGQGAIGELPVVVKELGATGAAVITDRSVERLWAEPVVQALSGVGIDAHLLAIEPGEQAKTLGGLERVLGFLEDSRIDRGGIVIALGGGTVGDLAGFASAVWLRGVRCVQVPTTLLAMVDSSVGGKTAINTERTKNSVGAFWQPSAVVADLSTLATLPDDEVLAAFAEVVKYGVAMDAELAERTRIDGDRLRARDLEALEPVVSRCVELKAGVVAADEREQGRRAILNYGHTVGHAIEAASGYTATHGRAVAQGMRAAARLAAAMGLCEDLTVAAQDELLAPFGLPGPLPAVTPDAVLGALPRDKKAAAGRTRWVLPREVGRADVGVEAPPELIERVVRDTIGR